MYHKYYDDVLILLKTGLRISELCGLTVADIDFKNEVVIIDHQLLKSKEQGYYIETPKTKSGIRQVPLSRETIQAFQRVMKKRPKAEPFVIDGRSNFLFVNHKGKPKVAIDYNELCLYLMVCQIAWFQNILSQIRFICTESLTSCGRGPMTDIVPPDVKVETTFFQRKFFITEPCNYPQKIAQKKNLRFLRSPYFTPFL